MAQTTQTKYSRYYTFIKPLTGNPIVRSFSPYIFSLLTIGFLVIFAIRPTVSTILNLQKSIENNQQILQGLDSKAQSLIDGRKNLDALSPLVKSKIGLAIPENPSVPLLIGSLRNISTASISALQIQPLVIVDNTETKTKMALGEVVFSYNIQGSYKDLLTALGSMQRSPRLINIDSIVINKSPDGPTILSINGKAYYLK